MAEPGYNPDAAADNVKRLRRYAELSVKPVDVLSDDEYDELTAIEDQFGGADRIKEELAGLHARQEEEHLRKKEEENPVYEVEIKTKPKISVDRFRLLTRLKTLEAEERRQGTYLDESAAIVRQLTPEIPAEEAGRRSREMLENEIRAIERGDILVEGLEVVADNGSLVEGDLPGRAEYEANIYAANLFEKEDPKEVFPWANELGYGAGMIIAPRGSGKTFFIRKLMEEIPTEIHVLDKDRLENGHLKYDRKGAENPRLIVFDDLHYLLEAKRRSELDKDMVQVTAKEILDVLESGVKRAKELNAKILFISTGTPIDLYDRFSDKDDRVRFLTILKDCGISDFDINSVKEGNPAYVSQFREKRNILWFREETEVKIANELRRQIGAVDIPIIEARGESEGHLVMDGEEWEGIFKTSFGGKKKDIFARRDNLTFEPQAPFNQERRTVPLIARVREFMTLAQKLGKVNRETLGIESGIPYGKTFSSGEKVYAERTARFKITKEHQKIMWVYKDWMDLDEGAKEEEFKGDFLNYLKHVLGRSKLSAAEVAKARVIKGLYKSDEPNDLEVGTTISEAKYKADLGNKKGELNQGDGWIYTGKQIAAVKKKVQDAFKRYSGREKMSTLAEKLLSLSDDATLEDIERAHLEHSFEQE